MLTDYVRKKMGYSAYDPTPDEIKRYSTEIQDYNDRVTNLQYVPTEEELSFLVKTATNSYRRDTVLNGMCWR